jgi:hypothetical protein
MAQLQRGGSLSRRCKFGEISVPIAAKHTMEQLHIYSQFVRRLHHMDVEARLPQELDFQGEHEGNLAPIYSGNTRLLSSAIELWPPKIVKRKCYATPVMAARLEGVGKSHMTIRRRNIKGRLWSRLLSVGLIAYRRERPQ